MSSDYVQALFAHQKALAISAEEFYKTLYSRSCLNSKYILAGEC